MAHVGTPAYLPKQSAAGFGSSGLKLAIVSAVVVVTIAVAVAATASFIASSRAISPSLYHSLDKLENMNVPFAGVTVDRSFDQVEKARGTAALSGAAFDHRYDLLQNFRGTVPPAAILTTPDTGQYEWYKHQSLNYPAPAVTAPTAPMSGAPVIQYDWYKQQALHGTSDPSLPATTAPVDHRYDNVDKLQTNMRGAAVPPWVKYGEVVSPHTKAMLP